MAQAGAPVVGAPAVSPAETTPNNDRQLGKIEGFAAVYGSQEIRRDPTDVDKLTGKPLCYGHEDPAAIVCLTCRLNIVCRETKNIIAGLSTKKLSELELPDLTIDLEDDDGEEEDRS